MLRRALVPATLVVFTSLVGCAPESAEVEERVEGVEQTIIGGQLDTTNQAVVAVFGDNSACTGTIVRVKSGSAYVLTAAHCFGGGPIKYVVRGDDYENPDQAYQVVDYEIHPKYDENTQSFDFAMLRAQFAADSVPFIPPLTPQEDKLKPGTVVEHVGYGLISYPNGSTTKRHRTTGPLAEVAFTQISYNQPKTGPCSGDSGGPQLVDTPAGKRVAGVTSYGDQECKVAGVSGRVSSVYTTFILPFLGEAPGSSTSASTSAATSGVGGSTAEAAVSSSAATSGAGGAPSATSGAGASDLWTAGDVQPKEHAGDIVTTSCAIAQVRTESRADIGALATFALAAGAFGSRRRRR